MILDHDDLQQVVPFVGTPNIVLTLRYICAKTLGVGVNRVEKGNFRNTDRRLTVLLQYNIFRTRIRVAKEHTAVGFQRCLPGDRYKTNQELAVPL